VGQTCDLVARSKQLSTLGHYVCVQMVSDQMDMLSRDDAAPSGNSKITLVKEIAENGEAIVTFEDGRVVEFHADDTHFYADSNAMFTEADDPDGEEAESWFFADQIVSVQRH